MKVFEKLFTIQHAVLHGHTEQVSKAEEARLAAVCLRCNTVVFVWISQSGVEVILPAYVMCWCFGLWSSGIGPVA